MTELIVLGALALLFLIAFVTRRRFGVLGLGLAAGVVLATQFVVPLTGILESSADSFAPFASETLATLIIVLAPALLLLFGGPKYASPQAAVLGSLGFIVMALALLLEPLSRDVSWISDHLEPLVVLLARWQGFIVALAVAAAVFDMFMAHNPRLALRRSKH